MPRRNRLRVVLPLYGVVYAKFLIHWLEFIGQIGKYDAFAGLQLAELAPVDLAMNKMVTEALKHDDWDYLVSIEQDMRMPPGLLERFATLDPQTHPIVGALYFGRAQDDQRPVPGYWTNGTLNRLTYEQVCAMLPQRGGTAGLHRVDTVGMGATAIARHVFEKWPYTPEHPWFRFDYDHMGPIGHDVWFCVEAGRQGYPVHVDSSLIAKHIGDWQSDDVTYLATTEFALRAAPPVTVATAEAAVAVPFVGDRLRAETLAAVKNSGLTFQTFELQGDTAYHDLIAELWADGHSFISLEQDIVPADGALAELAACPEPWCAFGYEYPPFGIYAGMGCAKFSADLIARYPDALTETGRWADDTHPAKHWCRVDGWLKQYLTVRGEKQHIHGIVEHLHSGRPAHDCVITPPLPRDIPSAVTDAEAAELARLASGKRVLEMGAHLGFSTVVLARAASELVSVDWHQGDDLAGRGDTLEAFRANLRSHGVADRVTVRIGRFGNVLPKLRPVQHFDLIFIDGDHSYEAVKADIALALPLLRPGGAIALHDYGRFGVAAAVDEAGHPFEVLDSLAVLQPTPSLVEVS